MPTFKLTISYDGSAFHGWQRQPNRPTIQAEVERALAHILREPIHAVGSSRTDAGVHALGQVASFVTEANPRPDKLRLGLNAVLPESIAVVDVERVADSFDAIESTVSKRYRYVIHDSPVRPIFQRTQCWHVHFRLDVEAMNRAARSIIGRHDFSGFETHGSPRQSNVRTVLDCQVRRFAAGVEGSGWQRPDDLELRSGRQEDFLAVEVEADGFLYNMVRSIAGTLVDVGRGRRPDSWMMEVVNSRDRKLAGMTAPPHGLFLLKVNYERPEADG
jgi:tRNA pseudouridine38-40 synthase